MEDPLSAEPDHFAHNWSPSRIPKWESWSVFAILVLYLTVQLNNIRNLAFIGQDFSFHAWCTDNVLRQPDRWAYQDSTSRPLLYWIGSVCKRSVGDEHAYEVASFVFVILSALSLFMIHASTPAVIKTPSFRLGSLVFLAFLPLTLITSVVYAADTVVFLPFSLLVFALSRLLVESNRIRPIAIGGTAAVALSIGLFSKATFGFLIFGIVTLSVVFWRIRIFSRHVAVLFVLIAAGPPIILGVLLQIKVGRDLTGTPPRHTFDWQGTGEMTWRSLMVPYRSDLRILDAPGYWETGFDASGRQYLPLLANNSFSYPALLILGVFTDVMDFANQGALDNGAPRPDEHQRFATMSVWAGIGIAFFSACSLTAGVGELCLALWKRRSACPGLFIWLACAISWAFPLVATLPFVHNVYSWGYWLPRLIFPSVLSTGILFFATVERCLQNRSVLIRSLFLFLIGAEAIVHIKSVWY